MARSPPRTSRSTELVIITGLSGSGKGTVLKSLEDLGYYSVDNLPVELIPKFGELDRGLAEHRHAGTGGGRARRGGARALSRSLQADCGACSRRHWFSWRRTTTPSSAASARRAGRIRWAPASRCVRSIRRERRQLAPIRALAGHIINTSKFTVHELRDLIGEKFRGGTNRPRS